MFSEPKLTYGGDTEQQELVEINWRNSLKILCSNITTPTFAANGVAEMDLERDSRRGKVLGSEILVNNYSCGK
jgi:hypothetical protein